MPDGGPGNRIERAKKEVVQLDTRTTAAWNAPEGVLESTTKMEGRLAPNEISGLSRFISDPQLRQDIIDAMANGGIEVPEGANETVTDEQLQELGTEMVTLFQARIDAEERRVDQGADINGYHNELHNKEVAERILDIVWAMDSRPPYEVVRIMVLEIAPLHDAGRDAAGNETPHIGVAVRKEADGKSNEQISHELIDARLRDQNTPLYYRVMASGMTLATALFWDGKTIQPTTLYESVVTMADLAGYRENYAAWADQSVGVLKERIGEMKRDLTFYQSEKEKGKPIAAAVITELTKQLPADNLQAFFGWQGGFVNFLKSVNKDFGDKVIRGGEENLPWTPVLREKEAIVAALKNAADESSRTGTDIRELYSAPDVSDATTISALETIISELETIAPEVAALRDRIKALAE